MKTSGLSQLQPDDNSPLTNTTHPTKLIRMGVYSKPRAWSRILKQGGVIP